MHNNEQGEILQKAQRGFQPSKTPVRSPAPDNSESGAILVVVLVLIFAVTLALLAYLYLNKNNTLIASNLAVQNAAQEATDQGLQDASAWLNTQTTWPEVLAGSTVNNLAPRFFLTMPSGYLVSSNANTTPVQTPTDPTYWTSCVSNNTCHSIGTVSYGSFSYQVEYVIFPTGGMSTQPGGNDQNQAKTPTIQSRYYVVYVHAMNSNGGGLGVTVQAVIRKVMVG